MFSRFVFNFKWSEVLFSVASRICFFKMFLLIPLRLLVCELIFLIKTNPALSYFQCIYGFPVCDIPLF